MSLTLVSCLQHFKKIRDKWKIHELVFLSQTITTILNAIWMRHLFYVQWAGNLLSMTGTKEATHTAMASTIVCLTRNRNRNRTQKKYASCKLILRHMHAACTFTSALTYCRGITDISEFSSNNNSIVFEQINKKY